MAAINFPNPGTQTPPNTFSPNSSPKRTLNGLTYIWNGVGWRITSSGVSGASVTISDTSPGNSLNGDLWWDSGAPTSLFIYYTDDDSSQWVPATPQTDSWYINGGELVPSQTGQTVNIGTGSLIAGSANISGLITAQGQIGSGDLDLGPYSILFPDGRIEQSTDSSSAYILRNKTSGTPVVTFDQNGTAIFGGSSLYTSDTNVQVTGDSTSAKLTLNSPGNITFSLATSNETDSSGYFVIRDESSSVDRLTIDSLGGIKAYSGFIADGTIKSELNDDTWTAVYNNGAAEGYKNGSQTWFLQADGSAAFSGTIEIGNSLTESAILLAPGGSNIFYGYDGSGGTTSIISASGKATFTDTILSNGWIQSDRTDASGSCFYGTLNSVEKVNIKASGSATFAGTVTANGSVLTLSGGGTYDIGDRSQKLDTALTTLKTAAAASVDFAALKAAIATALANI